MAHRTFSYRWTWNLQSPPEALWPLIADSNRFNRDTGVPRVANLSGNQDLEAGRRHLALRVMGVPVEWEEDPFEWVEPRRFGVVRRYTRGPVEEMRVLAELEPSVGGGTELTYRVSAVPRNLFGYLAIPG